MHKERDDMRWTDATNPSQKPMPRPPLDPPFGKQLAEDGVTLVDDPEEQNMLALIRAVKESGFRFFPDSPASRAEREARKHPATMNAATDAATLDPNALGDGGN